MPAGLIGGLLLSVHSCLGECGRPSSRAQLCRDCLRRWASAAGTPCQIPCWSDCPPPQIWQRLGYFKNLKAEARKARRPPPVVGVLGCMAERLKQRLLESDRLVDLVAGPDAYRWGAPLDCFGTAWR